MLDTNPALLPVDRFADGFGPPVSLGREVRGIDNRFVSPTGRMTIVETKLWRNPQAVREVLAQILDYASRLSKLAYADLERDCQNVRGSAVGPSGGIYELVSALHPDQVVAEPQFHDALQHTLREGRFLLLIIGDGIRENLHGLLELLHESAHLNFTFGLIEMQLYRDPGQGGHLVIPNVVAHSTEIVRSVVRVSHDLPAGVQVDVPASGTDAGRKLTEQEFLDSILEPEAKQFCTRVLDWAHYDADLDIKLSRRSVAIRRHFSGWDDGVVLLRIHDDGRVRVTPPKLRERLTRAGVGTAPIEMISEWLRQLFPEISSRPDKTEVVAPMRAKTLLANLEQVLEIYGEAKEHIAAVDPGPDGVVLDRIR